MEAYYYAHMSKHQQSVYFAMKEGLKSLLPSFAVPRAEGRELTDIFFKLRLDCPEIFYVTGFKYRCYADSANIEFVPDYLFDKAKIKEHIQAMEARVTKLSRPAAAMTEWEKELYIHDFICRNVRYDKLKKPYSHEIIGPLGQGVGVCEGIAKTVKILCDTLGIWCMIAVSEANPEKGIKYRHAWNVVRLGGNYYHLDATFDNSLSRDNMVRYDYFNLSDGRIFRDHEPVICPVPLCSRDDSFYYREKKLSFTKMEDVSKRAIQAIRKKMPLVFQWRGGYLTREVLQELCHELEAAANTRGKHARISLNWPQAVIYTEFSEVSAGREWVMEQANQGEEQAAASDIQETDKTAG